MGEEGGRRVVGEVGVARGCQRTHAGDGRTEPPAWGVQALIRYGIISIRHPHMHAVVCLRTSISKGGRDACLLPSLRSRGQKVRAGLQQLLSNRPDNSSTTTTTTNNNNHNNSNNTTNASQLVARSPARQSRQARDATRRPCNR